MMNRMKMHEEENATIVEAAVLREWIHALERILWSINSDPRKAHFELNALIEKIEDWRGAVEDRAVHDDAEMLNACDGGELAAESKNVLPRRTERFVVGCISEVNGSDAVLVDGFKPTRGELKMLGLYYLGRYFEERLCAACGYGGSSDWRIMQFSGDRFDSIEQALGPRVPELKIARRHWEKRLDEAEEDAARMFGRIERAAKSSRSTPTEVGATDECCVDGLQRQAVDDSSTPP